MGPKKTQASKDTTPSQEVQELEGDSPPLASEARRVDTDTDKRFSVIEQNLQTLTEGLARLTAAQLGQSVELPTAHTSQRRAGKAPASTPVQPGNVADTLGNSSDEDDWQAERDDAGGPFVDVFRYRGTLGPGFDEYPPDNGDYTPELFPIDKDLTVQRISAKYTNPRADPLIEYQTLYCYALYAASACTQFAQSLHKVYETKALEADLFRELVEVYHTMEKVSAGHRDRIAFVRYKFDPKADPFYKDIALDKIFNPGLAHHGSSLLTKHHREYTRLRDKAAATQLAKAAAALRTGGQRPKPDENDSRGRPKSGKGKEQDKEKK